MTEEEHQHVDPTFYDRADAHIHLSNAQMDDQNPGKVSASMMYATARYNAYISWMGFSDADAMTAERDDTIEYFVEQYRLMLAENLDDYIRRFDEYRRTSGGTHPDD